MNATQPGDRPAPDGPVDEADHAILAAVRGLIDAADPMPADLPDRIRFALALRDLDAEVARITAVEDRPLLSVRGEAPGRAITFESASLTIMIRVEANGDGTVRVDGWLAPPQSGEARITAGGGAHTAPADAGGRFAFARVAPGPAQLAVQTATAGPGQGRTVATPAFTL
jgi:hypothetical protein